VFVYVCIHSKMVNSGCSYGDEWDWVGGKHMFTVATLFIYWQHLGLNLGPCIC
jgi:hypothetical protein